MRRILVADDSPASRSLVASALSDVAGVEVARVSSGVEAIKLVATDSFDLVLTDVNMPDINGLELLRFIKTNERLSALPVLVISTDTAEAERLRALSLGADGYLAKPFTPDQLRAAIEQVFSSQ
ncbi:MAG TPA: response regulator [Pyrinomonadaceae bacterium]|nr:response regulator [Pyrinomonadaceae bacterium]